MQRTLTSAGFEVACFRSAEDFLDAHQPSRPGCILLDVRLPDGDGLRVQEELLARAATTSIVFMSGHGDVKTAVRALKSGAVDFLQKPFGESDLLGAVRNALKRDMEKRQHQARLESLTARRARLTPRENQVLDLLVADRDTKAIAGELGISPRTAETHRQRVMHKMEVDSVAALTRLVLGADSVSDDAKPAPEGAEPARHGDAPRSE